MSVIIKVKKILELSINESRITPLKRRGAKVARPAGEKGMNRVYYKGKRPDRNFSTEKLS